MALAPDATVTSAHALLYAPRVGTLIFHPSLLPRRRGPDAVRRAVSEQDPFTGATWFWADDGLDTGAVAEQELVAIPNDLTPGEVYRRHILPAGLRCFTRIWQQLLLGYMREVPQEERIYRHRDP